jgi:hypothetical protein
MQQLLRTHIKSYYPNRPGPGNVLVFKKMLSFTDLHHNVPRYPLDRFRRGILLVVIQILHGIPHQIPLTLSSRLQPAVFNSYTCPSWIYLAIFGFTAMHKLWFSHPKVTKDVNPLQHLLSLILRNRLILFFLHFSKEREVSFMFSSELPLDNINSFFIR